MTPEVITLFVLNGFFLLFASLAFVIASKVSLFYEKNSTTSQQYMLEKQSYLAMTVTKYLFAIKIPLFLFFIFSLEKIALILPGAMCATGVVNATVYGPYLLILKLLNLFLFAFWLVINAKDMKDEHLPYTPFKYKLLLPFFILLLIEIILEITMFLSIKIDSIVDCCGVVFSSSDGSYMASLLSSPFRVQASFLILSYLSLVLSYFRQDSKLYAIASFLFLSIALITLIGSFGTYIYELPTHHCPFCLLAQEYHYIGYLLYTLLFLGTFFGILVSIIETVRVEKRKYMQISLLFISSYVFLVCGYVLIYYAKHGVLL